MSTMAVRDKGAHAGLSAPFHIQAFPHLSIWDVYHLSGLGQMQRRRHVAFAENVLRAFCVMTFSKVERLRPLSLHVHV
jgi:hypothetical protein